MVRGVPDADFHARVSALRDRAEEAGRGFLSVEVIMVHVYCVSLRRKQSDFKANPWRT